MNQHSDNDISQHREWQAQEQARLAQRAQLPAGSDPLVDSYRAVLNAIQQAPLPPVPQDFAASVARRLRAQEVDDYIDRWMLRGVGLLAAIGILWYCGPSLMAQLHLSADWVASQVTPVPLLRSPLVWATALAAAAAGLCDRGLQWLRRA